MGDAGFKNAGDDGGIPGRDGVGSGFAEMVGVCAACEWEPGHGDVVFDGYCLAGEEARGRWRNGGLAGWSQDVCKCRLGLTAWSGMSGSPCDSMR